MSNAQYPANRRVITGRFILAWIVAFIVWFAGTYVVNVLLVDYSRIAYLSRPWEQELKLYPALALADVLFTGVFVWFYARQAQPKHRLGEGARYGFAVSLLTFVPISVRYFVAQPVPVKTLIQQVVCFAVLLTLLGALVAFVYDSRGRLA